MKIYIKLISLSFYLNLIILFSFSCLSNKTEIVARNAKQIETNKASILSEMQNKLKDEFSLWYPLTVDTVFGGFFSDINYKWQLSGLQNKMIVTQARHVWATSNAAMFYSDNKYLLKVAEHGFQFLKNKMWDKKYGGFYDLVDRKGEPIKESGEIIKRAYGNAFAIYGLAAYYRVSKNADALKLAQEEFNWLERSSYDSLYGGYYQFLTQEGKPYIDGYKGTPPKDQNSSIHILEAYTELYKVWPDAKLKERLNSLLHLIRDTITTEKGYMNLFFKRNWTPISFRNSSDIDRKRNYEFDHVSFGHDVETGYLLLEASEVLGLENDSTTQKVAKKMVDHTIKNGLDQKNGGVFDGGYYFSNSSKPAIIKNTKEWWSQAEAFNSFLLMSTLYPNDKLDYFENFCRQWEYTKNYILDKDYGGWYIGGIDIEPNNKYLVKGSIWKCNYHTSRSLINCIKRLSKAVEK